MMFRDVKGFKDGKGTEKEAPSKTIKAFEKALGKNYNNSNTIKAFENALSKSFK